MPRIGRMVIEGEQAVYHVMSRTALDGFPFRDAEKDVFVKVIYKFSQLIRVSPFSTITLLNRSPHRVPLR